KEGLSLVYNPRGGLATTSGLFLSPRTVLVHELDHAVDDLITPYAHALRRGFKNIRFGNFEELRVNRGYEQKAAIKFGDIKQGQVTRTNNGGKIFRTEDFDSNQKTL